MPSLTDLEKQLKSATKTGKYVVGRREVLSSLKGSKLLVWSSSANVPLTILDQCKSLSIPALRYEGSPIDLGHACGIPFRVSVIAIKSAGDADISQFKSSVDYTTSGIGPLSISVASKERAKRSELEDKGEKAKVEERPAVTPEAPKEKKGKKVKKE